MAQFFFFGPQCKKAVNTCQHKATVHVMRLAFEVHTTKLFDSSWKCWLHFLWWPDELQIKKKVCVLMLENFRLCGISLIARVKSFGGSQCLYVYNLLNNKRELQNRLVAEFHSQISENPRILRDCWPTDGRKFSTMWVELKCSCKYLRKVQVFLHIKSFAKKTKIAKSFGRQRSMTETSISSMVLISLRSRFSYRQVTVSNILRSLIDF